jgi:hypothetical protein
MTGQSISHYKILEKLGEVPKFPTPACVPCTLAGRSASQRMVGILSIPTSRASAASRGIIGSYGEGDL